MNNYFVYSGDKNNAEQLENVNPTLYKKLDERKVTADDENEDVVDDFDAREIFGMNDSDTFLN